MYFILFKAIVNKVEIVCCYYIETVGFCTLQVWWIHYSKTSGYKIFRGFFYVDDYIICENRLLFPALDFKIFLEKLLD